MTPPPRQTPPRNASRRNTTTTARLSWLAFFFLVLPLAGCGAYSLGSKSKIPFSTLSLAPIENTAYVPQAQALLHTQLADAISQESGLRLVATGGAATLHVRIVGYTHSVAATNPDDTALGSSFNIRLTANCTLTDNRTEKPYFTDRRIEVSVVAHSPTGTAAGSFSAVEYETLPVLTRDLARRIRDTVTGVW
ncbi:MAG: LPS assembly lipoprotein LptE [Puniceicoccales bacterium]|jgi:hypothetical protein|nr:LPS assembly lipoprotein LptE [Puniceicoccales bacterium]